jgi:ATP-dependent helicase/nuclease subunit A
VSDSSAALEQDARARREALDPARSMLLQAPAGSGKTTVLTARYLALLASVDAPEEILAMTFTRKAAAEMRQRVIEALHAADSGKAMTGIASDVLQAARERDAARGWDLLRNPSRLRIDTIDALNYWLASQLPVASRASPGLQIAADPGALYRRAARRCLELAPSEPDIAAATDLVFTRLDNNWDRVESRLAEMLKERSHWLPRVAGAGDEALVDRIQSSLASTLKAELTAAMAPLTAPLLRESEFILEHALRTRNGAALAQVVRLSADPAGVAHWRELAALALAGDKWRQRFDVRAGFKADDKPMKTRAEEWVASLQRIPDLREALVRVRDLPDAQLSAPDREALGALGVLLIRAAQELQLEFASSGSVDFSYVSSAARAALTEQGEPTDLALRTGAALRHILVDEFQDTSYEQLKLLHALMAGWEAGDGRTLFVVGDPMQSIYQFREAEVGLFLRARDRGVANTRLESLQLRRNFRSREEVIEWVNRKFEGLFPPEDNARLAAIRYLSSMPGPKAMTWQGAAVTLHAFADKDVAGEADRVVQIARAARAQDATASIAVLVAARPHAAPLVARLCAAGMSVRGVNLEPLSDRPVVRDLSALTRCLLHGADRSAWLALLRSPWCGLTLAELDQLGIADEGDLFGWLCARASERAHERIRRLCDALAPAIAQQERGLPLWQRVERCWLRLGGPAVYPGDTDLRDARRFLDALALHQDPDALAGESLSEITQRLFSSSAPQAGAIDVMTMHAAKGLEWDVVILPCLGRATANNRDRLLHWIELPRDADDTDLLLAPIRGTDTESPASLASYIKRLRRERTTLERVRLLYVATTRARKALHLSAALKTTKDDAAPSLVKGSLLNTLWHSISEEFLRLYREMPAQPVITPSQGPGVQLLKRLPAKWRVPELPAVASANRLSLSTPAPGDAPEYSWVGLTARAIGTVVHAELRRMADTPGSSTPDYHAWLLELGVDPGELATAIARIREALQRTLGDERGRWLLSDRHRESHSEWRLTGKHEGRIVNVIFDRMLVDEHGQRWVIDYKTSTHEGGAIQEFIDREAERYRPQMQRYAALAARIDGAPVRVALYFPLIGMFRELTLAPS